MRQSLAVGFQALVSTAHISVSEGSLKTVSKDIVESRVSASNDGAVCVFGGFEPFNARYKDGTRRIVAHGS